MKAPIAQSGALPSCGAATVAAPGCVCLFFFFWGFETKKNLIQNSDLAWVEIQLS